MLQENEDARFRSLLNDFDLQELDGDCATIYGMWADLRLAFTNREWFRFAAENGGGEQFAAKWGSGRCVLDSVAAPLRPFFAENYRRCLSELRPWQHTYECSSADRFRKYCMKVYPLGNGEGLLVINSLRVESQHSRISSAPLIDRYCTQAGIFTQCCHCRCMRRVENPRMWDWVPDWVRESPEGTSHGICPKCVAFYYSKSRPEKLILPFSTIDQQ